jgi:hypothetical protein
MGNFTSFISTATGFGTISVAEGKPSLKVAYGSIPLNKMIINGKEIRV